MVDGVAIRLLFTATAGVICCTILRAFRVFRGDKFVLTCAKTLFGADDVLGVSSSSGEIQVSWKVSPNSGCVVSNCEKRVRSFSSKSSTESSFT